ncbi:MAG: excinuclease ABC subunit UvrC [Clostridia bacterium]|nr:excinuclease ABC subunit UvrC [Clostridia bacterium]MDY4083879.1 excinuclease ABC subunit UvrC [Eubacteriales bacterium]
MDLIRQKVKDLPENSGVYIMYSADRQILYVGKARNLKKRVTQYFGSPVGKTDKVLIMVSKIADFEYIITRNEIEALVLENNLIKKHQPPYNILLKDDKSYPFIKINTKQAYPKVEVVRKLKNDGAKYFGPYMQGITSKEIVDLIYSAFPLRSCSLDMSKPPKGHRPCLNYHIGRCKAPCMGYETPEQYAETIAKVVSFLQGNDKSVANILTRKMQEASEQTEYEIALMYKQKLAVLDKLIRRQVTALPKDFDLDVFAIASNGLNVVVSTLFVRAGKLVGSDKQVVDSLSLTEQDSLSNYIMRYYDGVPYIPQEVITSVELEDADVLAEYLGEKKGKKVNVITPHQGVRKQLVDMAMSNACDYLDKSLSLKERQDNMTVGAMIQLQEFLKLSRMPIRMECYDISHISGTNKVGSMVVFINGQPAKSHYRKFHIKTVEGNNDFESLQEVLRRRISRLLDEQEKDESFSSRPDLIIIDGGKGQLSSVMQEVEKAGLSGVEIVGLAKSEEEIFFPGQSQSVLLPRNSYALKLVQRIRDEAHRFAITFHRNERKRTQTKSRLTDIAGVGEVKQKRLIQAFRTMDNIRNASVEDLLLVKGMDRPTAIAIYEHFHVGDTSED